MSESVEHEWVIHGAGRTGLLCDGNSWPEAPNTTVLVLCIGLASLRGEWASRSFVARKLYPDADSERARVALRQCLCRLRDWLGDDQIEGSNGGLRLVGKWRISPRDKKTTRGRSIEFFMDLDHPWIDEIRRDICDAPPTPVHDPAPEAWANAVETSALLDPDIARAILVSAGNLADLLPVHRVQSLLAITRPRERTDSAACEHLILQALTLYRVAALRESVSPFLRAHRIATQTGSRSMCATTASLVMYSYLEAGDVAASDHWITHLQSYERSAMSRIEVMNARAAYLWNMNDLEGAAAVYRSGISLMAGSSRLQRLHFWTNYGVLLSDLGMREETELALLEADQLTLPIPHLNFHFTAQLARNTVIGLRGDWDEACSRLCDQCDEEQQAGHALNAIYAKEAMAETCLRMGDLSRAKRAFREAEASRLASAGRLPPRLIARKARIYSA